LIDPVTDVLSESVPKLEQALRDFSARAMECDTPFPLRLQFFQIVPMVAATLRDFRKGAGMAIGLPMDIVILLGVVRAEAYRLLYDPGLDREVVLPLLTVIDQLVDQTHLGLVLPAPPPTAARRGRRAVRH
jgi:hypothetical protein